MKKILIRGHMSPFDNWDAAAVLDRDLIGTNSGNLIFLNSIIRILMTEETQIDIWDTRYDTSDKEIDRINEEYDCVVLPFANAFRLTYQSEMQKITAVVKKLKIPCIVVGVGISVSLKRGLQTSYPFDDTVKEFVKAVLDKSAVIGTRGAFTSEYLKQLGFKEGSEHCVIGCPSMFWYGADLPQIEKKMLTEDSAVSINWKMDVPREIHEFMRGNIPYFHDLCYVPQVTDELRLMYYGIPFPEGKYVIPKKYPGKVNHPWYCEDRARGFINVKSWLEYMRKKDFSFGTRIHGNIAALLAGTPAFIVASDYRIRELAEYHEIPHINYNELEKSQNVFELYGQADYSGYNRGHRARFENYVGFLEQNGLDHIFQKNSETVVPYDEKMDELSLQPPLRPFMAVSQKEQGKRLAELQARYLRMESNYLSLKPLEPILPVYRGAKKIKNIFVKE